MSELNPSNHELLEDWKWLIEGNADRWLIEFAKEVSNPIGWTRRLRKEGISGNRIRLILEQIALRPLGQRKFRHANQMFFQRVLLEQATSEILADYKAQRYSGAGEIVDLCCGLGGDLISLAQQAAVVGVDLNPVACLLARANCSANAARARLVTQDAAAWPVAEDDWVHIDPDRRVGGVRSTKADFFSPDLEYLAGVINRGSNIGIKLAPATRTPLEWNAGQRQWIGDRQECKQQMVWWGALSHHPGKRSAAAIDDDGSVLFEWVEQEAASLKTAERLGEALYEPHPAILAGRMTDSLADEHGLARLATDIPYLTGPELRSNALTCYRILDTCRLDRQDVADCLARLNCGMLEIKKRGVDQGLIRRFSKIKLKGDQKRVLILTRLNQDHIAIVCQRIGESFRGENTEVEASPDSV